MKKKYGNDWKLRFYKPEENESKFEQTLKRFFSPKPRHSVNFKDYKKELYQCVQNGVNPVFPFEILSFDSS